MNKRPRTKSRLGKAEDPYLPALAKIWPTILSAYDDFRNRKPIVEYRPVEKIVYAYPALPYINDLTVRTREQTRRLYVESMAAGEFLVFVRDSSKRVLRSYVFPVEQPMQNRSESTVS